ncbi:MAG: hypothetical protein ACI4MV_00425 [Christensenellales bacterium]
MNEELKKALYKKAIGYTAKEVVEEYGGEEGNLVKKKVSKKHVPPDMSAIKALMELQDVADDLSDKSEEELQEMLKELTRQLYEPEPKSRAKKKANADEKTNKNKETV